MGGALSQWDSAPNLLYLLSVILNCCFDLLRLDADIVLRGGGGGVLQESLNSNKNSL
jgi:hypothetical protein